VPLFANTSVSLVYGLALAIELTTLPQSLPYLLASAYSLVNVHLHCSANRGLPLDIRLTATLQLLYKIMHKVVKDLTKIQGGL